MRIYECVFIMRPDIPEEEVDRFLAQMQGVVTSTGGTVQKTEKWGRRRLAYEVRRQREGQYVIVTMECDPPTIREFERVLKVSEPIIKFQTVRIDEELKRLEKMRQKREKRRAARPAAPTAAAPAPPTPAPTPAPTPTPAAAPEAPAV